MIPLGWAKLLVSWPHPLAKLAVDTAAPSQQHHCYHKTVALANPQLVFNFFILLFLFIPFHLLLTCYPNRALEHDT